METIFKVAKYEKTASGFNHLGYDEYTITYLKGTKVHQLRVVVNGILSNQKVNLVDFSKGYRKIILEAISEYSNGKLCFKNETKKFVTLNYIKQFYSKTIIRNVENYLLGIDKEESRDKLTKFNLI
jgi:hypothetical protein